MSTNWFEISVFAFLCLPIGLKSRFNVFVSTNWSKIAFFGFWYLPLGLKSCFVCF